MPFDNYGDRWRLHRRLIGEQFNPKPVEVFKSQQLKHTRFEIFSMFISSPVTLGRKLLTHILDDPKRTTEHVRYAVGVIVMEVSSVWAAAMTSSLAVKFRYYMDLKYSAKTNHIFKPLRQLYLLFRKSLSREDSWWRIFLGVSHSSLTMKGDKSIISLVRYVPEWFPGAGFQRKARV